jgi:hypothetical protein
MGSLIVFVSLFGLWHAHWLLDNSRYGRRLARWFGAVGGMRVLRGFLITFVVFGILLAADVIRPIHWNKR